MVDGPVVARHQAYGAFRGEGGSPQGPEVLVDAATRLLDAVPDLELVFVGNSNGRRDGRPFRDWVASRAAPLGGRCRFIDHLSRDRLPEWYAAARVVAVPSRHDSGPMVMLEAMASGRPVVSTTATGLSEVVDPATGAVVPPDDPDALAAALKPFLLDPALAASAGERARAFVDARLRPEHIAREREGCYREAMARHRRR